MKHRIAKKLCQLPTVNDATAALKEGRSAWREFCRWWNRCGMRFVAAQKRDRAENLLFKRYMRRHRVEMELRFERIRKRCEAALFGESSSTK